MTGPSSLRPSRSFSSAINDLAKNSLRSDRRDRQRDEGEKDREMRRQYRDREMARSSRFSRDREQDRLDEVHSSRRRTKEDRQYRSDKSPHRHRSRSRERGRRREGEKRLPENFTISVRQDDTRRGRSRDRTINNNRVDARELLDNLRQQKETIALEEQPPRKKCAFWPNCKSGDACPFVHPTEPCKYFPNCTHAAECLFLHPSLPCRFQDRCMNETCNYQHSAPFASVLSHRMTAAVHSMPPITITCRFHPNCANINCPYVHPV